MLLNKMFESSIAILFHARAITRSVMLPSNPSSKILANFAKLPMKPSSEMLAGFAFGLGFLDQEKPNGT